MINIADYIEFIEVHGSKNKMNGKALYTYEYQILVIHKLTTIQKDILSFCDLKIIHHTRIIQHTRIKKRQPEWKKYMNKPRTINSSFPSEQNVQIESQATIMHVPFVNFKI